MPDSTRAGRRAAPGWPDQKPQSRRCRTVLFLHLPASFSEHSSLGNIVYRDDENETVEPYGAQRRPHVITTPSDGALAIVQNGGLNVAM